jgi:hypothetical protein
MDALVWIVALLVVGLAVLVLEVFLPSGGVLGFLSVLAIGAAIVMAFVEQGAALGLTVLAISFVAVPAVLALAFRWFPDTPLGRRVLHTGDWGTASQLKVMTNFLCTAHLVALAEALTVCKAMGLDMNTTYEAIRISSGNSFVHETESQVILNGSRDINFTMDLVSKDVGLFDKIAQETGVPVEMSPLIVRLFKEGEATFGSREFSPNIIRRYEEPLGIKVLGTGFPDQMVDDEPEERGYEVVPKR